MATQPNVIELEGDAATLLRVRDIPGLSVSDHGQRNLGGGRFRISAQATDEAIAELRGRGVAVTVLQTGEEMQRHLEKLERLNKDGGG